MSPGSFSNFLSFTIDQYSNDRHSIASIREPMNNDKLKSEEAFHDAWARQIQVESIDPELAFHPDISPETHYAASRARLRIR